MDECTVVQNCQETERKDWATRSSVRLHRSLIRLLCTARMLIRLHARLLIHGQAGGKVNDKMSQTVLVLSPWGMRVIYILHDGNFFFCSISVRAYLGASEVGGGLWHYSLASHAATLEYDFVHRQQSILHGGPRFSRRPDDANPNSPQLGLELRGRTNFVLYH